MTLLGHLCCEFEKRAYTYFPQKPENFLTLRYAILWDGQQDFGSQPHSSYHWLAT
jgi:hypothetical protein